MKVLVLGLGNPIITDDAVGVRLAEALREMCGDPPGVDWEPECSVGGLNLVDLLAGYDRVLLFDSIRTAGGRPGEWHRFDAAALRATQHLSNVHDANFATALELGRRLGLPLPADAEIHIFAAEIVENRTFGESLSPELAAAWPALRAEILAEAARLLPAAD